MAKSESPSLKNEIRKTVQEEITRALANALSSPCASKIGNSSQNTSSSSTLTFEEFYQKRERDRQEDFVPKSKKKTRFQKKMTTQEDKEVEFKVGMAYCDEGKVKYRRGKNQTVRVKASATRDMILQKACEKHTQFDQAFDDSVTYTLLYQDFSEVKYIPGTQELFKLSSFKQAIGRDYKRLVFYIIPCNEIYDIDGGSEDEIQDKPHNAVPTVSLTAGDKVSGVNYDAGPTVIDGKGTNTKSLNLSESSFSIDSFMEKYGKGVLHDETCQKCGAITEGLHSAGVHSFPSGVIKVYAQDDDFICINCSQPRTVNTECSTAKHEQYYDKQDKEYEVYSQLFDSDDDECEEPILDTYTEMNISPPINVVAEKPLENSIPITSVLKSLSETVCKDKMQVARIRRRRLWDDALRIFSKNDFSNNTLLEVIFIGEEGVDSGGPRREFFHLLMKKINESGVLSGDEQRRVFTSNPVLLAKHVYFTVGKMVATSLMQGGPGLECLSPAIFYYILGDMAACQSSLKVDDLSDKELLENLRKIEFMENEQMSDMLLNLGFTKVAWKEDELPLLQRLILEHVVITNNKAALDQFVSGIKSVSSSLYSSMTENKESFKAIFCYNGSQLSLEKFRSLIRVNYSPEGSNCRDKEEATIIWWEEMLDNCNLSLTKLLQFITGAEKVPPLGFERPINIQFYNKECEVKRLPYASTCALELFLPRDIESVEEITALLTQSIFDTCGFGLI